LVYEWPGEFEHLQCLRERAVGGGRSPFTLAAMLQRVLQITFLTFLICLCISVTVALGTFIYVRYGDAPSRVSELERRTDKLEAGLASLKQWHVVESTNRVFAGRSPENSRWGDVMLNASSNDVQSSRIMTSKAHRLVAAFLRDWVPHSEMQKFESFRIVLREGQVFLDAVPKPNEQISMEFTYAVICEDW
jgi:hypothetical protein